MLSFFFFITVYLSHLIGSLICHLSKNDKLSLVEIVQCITVPIPAVLWCVTQRSYFVCRSFA